MINRISFGAALGVICVNLCVGSSNALSEERTGFPAAARQHYEQGQALQNKGQFNEAISAYEEASKLGMDGFPRVHLHRAGSNLDLKKYDTAILQYTKFIEKFGLEESCRA